MTFSSNELSKIPHTLSEPRFAKYLQHSGNDKAKALALYQWNMQISSALVLPLHCLEVSTRNAAAERLEEVHTSLWPWSAGFIRGLPFGAKKGLQKVAKSEPTTGKVIAELKFVFWQQLFTKRQDTVLWNDHLKPLFPFAPQAFSTQELRKAIYDDIDRLRRLRNRIAHHEPIFTRNLQEDYDKTIRLIR